MSTKGRKAPVPGPATGKKEKDPLTPVRYTQREFDDAVLAGFKTPYPKMREGSAKRPLTTKEMESNTIARNKWATALKEKAKDGAEIRRKNAKVAESFKKAGTRKAAPKKRS